MSCLNKWEEKYTNTLIFWIILAMLVFVLRAFDITFRVNKTWKELNKTKFYKKDKVFFISILSILLILAILLLLIFGHKGYIVKYGIILTIFPLTMIATAIRGRKLIYEAHSSKKGKQQFVQTIAIMLLLLVLGISLLILGLLEH